MDLAAAAAGAELMPAARTASAFASCVVRVTSVVGSDALTKVDCSEEPEGVPDGVWGADSGGAVSIDAFLLDTWGRVFRRQS